MWITCRVCGRLLSSASLQQPCSPYAPCTLANDDLTTTIHMGSHMSRANSSPGLSLSSPLKCYERSFFLYLPHLFFHIFFFLEGRVKKKYIFRTDSKRTQLQLSQQPPQQHCHFYNFLWFLKPLGKLKTPFIQSTAWLSSHRKDEETLLYEL